MAVHFHAGQFEREYAPKRLRNWQVPKWYPSHRPAPRKGHTRVISNDKGHLLVGVAKREDDSPWGTYTDTWLLPKRITKQLARELSKVELREKPKKEDKNDNVKESPKNESETKIEQKLPGEKPDTKMENEEIKALVKAYEPGDFIEPKHKYKDPEMERHLRKKHKKHRTSQESFDHFLPLTGMYSNFDLAKKCFLKNLEHQPLPDTIADEMFRKLQIQGHRCPGVGLDEKPFATGIGWRPRGALGPTQCTKMQVYRPKTCAPIVSKPSGYGGMNRPCTSEAEKRTNIIMQEHVTPIELAICWDLVPEDPRDEPKRPTHIDGSNGSAAPAVFAMVHSPHPNQVEEEPKACNAPEGCGTIKSSSSRKSSNTESQKSSTYYTDKSVSKDERKVSDDIYFKNDNRQDIANALNRYRSYYNLENECKHKCSHRCHDEMQTYQNKVQSSPDLTHKQKYLYNESFKKRPCLACELQRANEKDFYKPNVEQIIAERSKKYNSNFLTTKPKVKLPKQRQPYTKKNYTVNTLMPPFSVWANHRGHDYPEYWRLSSVYQHSYKPISARKKPFISSVYK